MGYFETESEAKWSSRDDEGKTMIESSATHCAIEGPHRFGWPQFLDDCGELEL